MTDIYANSKQHLHTACYISRQATPLPEQSAILRFLHREEPLRRSCGSPAGTLLESFHNNYDANDKTPMKIEEKANTLTHLLGAVFALTCIWAVWPAAAKGWQMTMGVAFFIAGMFLMFLSSTVYHCLPKGKAKDIMRKCDHISIYVMIACSYTPICIGVVGGYTGWGFFAFQWLVVLLGTVYKIVAIGRWPRLSLAVYLIMGWSVLLIAPAAVSRLTPLTLSLLLAEGIAYTAGTYFFSHDSRPGYHAVWHIFVLLGAAAHWSAVLSIILS